MFHGASIAAFTLGCGFGSGAGSGRARVRRRPACLHYISRTRIFQDPGLLGTVFLTVPVDLGPGPD